MPETMVQASKPACDRVSGAVRAHHRNVAVEGSRKGETAVDFYFVY